MVCKLLYLSAGNNAGSSRQRVTQRVARLESVWFFRSAFRSDQNFASEVPGWVWALMRAWLASLLVMHLDKFISSCASKACPKRNAKQPCSGSFMGTSITCQSQHLPVTFWHAGVARAKRRIGSLAGEYCRHSSRQGFFDTKKREGHLQTCEVHMACCWPGAFPQLVQRTSLPGCSTLGHFCAPFPCLAGLVHPAEQSCVKAAPWNHSILVMKCARNLA
jgi:hypothetical protein